MERLASKPIREAIEVDLKKEVARIKEEAKIEVCLAVILVGDDPASHVYVASKEKACGRLGIKSIVMRLPAETSQAELLALIDQYNKDPDIHGILCQVPLPKHCNESEMIEAIAPQKDVDCFHPYNLGLLAAGTPKFMPCTPFGVLQILKRSQIQTSGKKVVIVGRSNIVGRPLSILLSLKEWNATVTLCHSGTADLAAECRQADILIAAIGRPDFITKEFVKPGAVLIDVGINRVEDPEHPKGARLVGDIDYEGVSSIASACTPVPGGVGPMTINMLMYNVVNAARFQLGLEAYKL
ncbi:MAG: bifunctional methylenetetrahydrofolate dehydrogenase/methenyltetrahydrofolate cyclohydrolase FolD [bacterium]|nr:bifunctional methylenetetrahydrofolate dehydrogenase/methenyltetrahydrofolate cyclohydrolase FolD [bacterium]